MHKDIKIPGIIGTAKMTRIKKNKASQFAARIDVKDHQVLSKFSKIGRNDPCYCGSGKKYKKCCQVGSSKELVDKLNEERRRFEQSQKDKLKNQNTSDLLKDPNDESRKTETKS